MGMTLEFINQRKALECFNKALELDPKNAKALANKGLMYSYLGDPEKCVKYSDRALTIDPNFIGARCNKAYAKIQLRQWKEGWDGYKLSLGTDYRSGRDYGLPDWDGFSPGRVIVYRDQGLGDEIMFASCVEDAKRYADITLDVSIRLEGLFQRSFGSTYGTGFDTNPYWYSQKDYDFQCSLGDLPRFYRNSDEAFPGVAYLKTDPELVEYYKGKLSNDKLNVGLAWNGGLPSTHRKQRCINLNDLSPIFDLGLNIVALEYDDFDPMGYDIQDFPETTRKRADHDQTAALIDALDFVITVPTTVLHTAGGLGKKTYCLTPRFPSWRFPHRGDFPWHKSVEIVKQGPSEPWAETVKRLARGIKHEYGLHRNRPKATSGLPCVSQ